MFIETNKKLLPTNDYVFKRIFGRPGNEEITKDLLNSILSIEVKNIELDSKTVLEKDVLGDKLGVLDIKAKLNGDIVCDIELQVAKQDYIEKRMLFYWSKLYISNFYEGNKYIDLKKTISILIADFELEILKNMPRFHTKWQIRESKYGKIILTDVFELHILEIPKLVYQLKNDSDRKLLNWLRFIKNPEVVEELDMEKNKVMAKAKEEYENFNQDEHEKYLAELREKYWHDMASFKDTGMRIGREEGIERGIKEGIKEGRKEGIKEGIEKGKKDQKQEIAKKMLDMNCDIKFIMQVTELCEEEIKKLES